MARILLKGSDDCNPLSANFFTPFHVCSLDVRRAPEGALCKVAARTERNGKVKAATALRRLSIEKRQEKAGVPARRLA